MRRLNRLSIAMFAVVAAFCSSNPANAGPILTWLGFGDDPPSSYSPARFWAPGAMKIHDDFHGPRISVVPPDRHPELPPTYSNMKYPTSIALPSTTILQPPTPPATSKAQ